MTEQGLLDAVRNVQAGIDIDKHFRLIDGCLRPRLCVWFRLRPLSRDDVNDVDELVQATMARVYTGMKKLERTEKFLRWVFVIAKNVRTTALLERRRQRRVAGSRTCASVALPWAEVESEEEARVETLTTLRVAIEALPPQQRQCLLLRISQDLSYEEIAATLHLSVNTVRNHLAGAKKRLRKALSGAQKATAVSSRIPGDAAHPRRRPPSLSAAITIGPPRLSSRSRPAPPITPPGVEPPAPAAGRSGTRRSRECRGRSSGGSWATA